MQFNRVRQRFLKLLGIIRLFSAAYINFVAFVSVCLSAATLRCVQTSKTTLAADVILCWIKSLFAAYEGHLGYGYCCSVARHVTSKSAVILVPEVYMKHCYATLHSRLVLINTD